MRRAKACRRAGRLAPPHRATNPKQAILNIYEINGYMLLSKLEPTSHGVKITLVAPATLWSQSMLRNRRDLPNDFEAKTVVAYLKQCGLPATVSTSIAGNNVEHTFEWPANLL